MSCQPACKIPPCPLLPCLSGTLLLQPQLPFPPGAPPSSLTLRSPAKPRAPPHRPLSPWHRGGEAEPLARLAGMSATDPSRGTAAGCSPGPQGPWPKQAAAPRPTGSLMRRRIRVQSDSEHSPLIPWAIIRAIIGSGVQQAIGSAPAGVHSQQHPLAWHPRGYLPPNPLQASMAQKTAPGWGCRFSHRCATACGCLAPSTPHQAHCHSPGSTARSSWRWNSS